MASNMGKGRELRELLENKQIRAQLKGGEVTVEVPFGGPWQGFTPDVPHTSVGPQYCQEFYNLVVRPSSTGHGEVITNDGGYVKLDEGTGTLGEDAGTGKEICMAAVLHGKDSAGAQADAESDTNMVVTEGDTTDDSQELYTMEANSIDWTVRADSGASGCRRCGSRHHPCEAAAFPGPRWRKQCFAGC